MISRRSLITGVAVVSLLATGVALAQGPRGGGRGMGGPMGPGFGAGLVLGELNLTEAQREQVRQIRDRHRDETRSVADRLAAARDKQQKAVETIPPDEALITSLTQDMVQAEVDAALLQARLNAEVWAVLTPEQQAQATKLRAERQARMDQRRQQMQQRRPQGK